MKFGKSLSILTLLAFIGVGNIIAMSNENSISGIQLPDNKLVIPAENEPNNTSSTANTLDLNGSIAGAINNVDDFYDFFKVTLPNDGKISFSLNPGALPGGYLDLYDQNGYNFLKQSIQTGDASADILTYENLKAGTYFIRVGGGGEGSYVLSDIFTATAIPSGNDAEPDDKQSESVAMNINSSMTGHLGFWGNGEVDNYDYFSFTTSYDGKIAFALVPEITLDGYLDLYDQNGYSFLRRSLQTGVGISDSLIYENLQAGTYFIRVGGGGYGSYTLNNIFTPTSIPTGNDVEPNNSYSQAISISNGLSLTGHIGFWGNGSVDDYDYYSFTLSKKSNITIKANPESSLDVVFDIYTSGGNYIVSGINAGIGLTDSLFYQSLEAGTYFIRISGGGYGSYTLSLSVMESGLSVENSIMNQLIIIADRERNILNINNISTSNISSVEIIDICGKIVLKEKLFNTNNQINFSGRNGLFLVKVTTGKSILVRRVLF
jgi:hypothetical protein